MTNISHLSESVEKGRLAFAEACFHQDDVPVEDEPWFEAEFFMPIAKEWMITLRKGRFEELTDKDWKNKGFSNISSVTPDPDIPNRYIVFSVSSATKLEVAQELNSLYLPF